MRTVLYGLGALALLLVSGLFCIVPRGWAHLEGRWLGGLAYFLSTLLYLTLVFIALFLGAR